MGTSYGNGLPYIINLGRWCTSIIIDLISRFGFVIKYPAMSVSPCVES